MSISVFDLFKVGIGPSSSHTVGPMNAARQFVVTLNELGILQDCARITVELFGSLGATGAGHGSPKAIILGLEGESPEHVAIERIAPRVTEVREQGSIRLLGEHEIPFDYRNDLVMHRSETLPFHPNGMRFTALGASGETVESRVYFSVGGGSSLTKQHKAPISSWTTPHRSPTPLRQPRSYSRNVASMVFPFLL